MGIQKVTILLCITFSSLQLSETTRRRYFANNNTRRNNIEPDDPNNCICFQGSEKLNSVPNLLDARNHGYERLIVYFYKDLDTQQIKMYTPGADKQYLIPDLPFEVGDSFLTVSSTDTIYNAINMSPHRTILNITNEVNVPNIDSIDTNMHIDESAISSIGYNPVTAAPIGMNTGKIETRPLDEVLPEVENQPDQNIDIKDAPTPANGVYEEVVSEVDTKVPGQIISGHIVNSLDVPESMNNVDHQNPRETKHTTGSHKYNWHENNNIYNKYNISSTFDSYNDLHGDGYLTFDKWFQQQLERFHNMHAQGSFNSIDVETLRILIQQTLLKNDIFISTNGIVTDSQGTIIDVSNLKLRPVLIGNSLAYEKFLKTSASEFSLPRNMPYLEALVISLKHPPKLLGIIPMGKTYIPQVGGSSAFNINTKKWDSPKYVASSFTKSQCINGKCETIVSGSMPFGKSSGRRIIPGYLNAPPPFKKEYTPMLHRRGSWRRNRISAKGVRKNQMDHKEVEPIIIDLKDLESGKNTRRFPSIPFGSILQQVAKVLFGTSRRGYHDSGKVDKEYADDYYDEDKPDFRIIGGSPATGSGTPVSSRGRSGYAD